MAIRPKVGGVIIKPLIMRCPYKAHKSQPVSDDGLAICRDEIGLRLGLKTTATTASHAVLMQ